MIDDIVLNKKESVERCVRQIRLYYAKPSDLPFEEDFLKQDAIAINLQRAAGSSSYWPGISQVRRAVREGLW
jgi:hypothetical protein